jgi:hypothetical protein
VGIILSPRLLSVQFRNIISFSSLFLLSVRSKHSRNPEACRAEKSCWYDALSQGTARNRRVVYRKPNAALLAVRETQTLCLLSVVEQAEQARAALMRERTEISKLRAELKLQRTSVLCRDLVRGIVARAIGVVSENEWSARRVAAAAVSHSPDLGGLL